MINLTDGLLKFLDNGVTSFHATWECEKLLVKSGYKFLDECEGWDVKFGGKYYTKRNNSSLIAFIVNEDYNFKISAAHSDSPTYKLKDVYESEKKGYLKLNVEGYGGMIASSWLDRPLGIAGRVIVSTDGGIESRLINIDRDVLIIPSLPIHLNRDINSGYKYNTQIDLEPIFSAGIAKSKDFENEISECSFGEVLARDLYLVNRQKSRVWGLKNEFVSSGRLDDLECVYLSLMAFLQSDDENSKMFCVFDNEEVGSMTKQGAMSDFFDSTLRRINFSLNKNEDEYYRMISGSILISCDNAHAIHPNHPELFDEKNYPVLNEGIVIKESANQKYTTDAVSRAFLKRTLSEVGVKFQTFSNRSDMVGGSTLGNLLNTRVSLNSVDVGMAQLAMHSSFETAGAIDIELGFNAIKAFFESKVKISDGNIRKV